MKKKILKILFVNILSILLIGFLGAWNYDDSHKNIIVTPITEINDEEISFTTYEIIQSVSGPISPILINATLPEEAFYKITIFSDEYVDGNLVNTSEYSTTFGDEPFPARSIGYVTFLTDVVEQQNFLSISARNNDIKLSGSYTSWDNEHLKSYSDNHNIQFYGLKNSEEVDVGKDTVIGIYLTRKNSYNDDTIELQDYLNMESFLNSKQALVIRANISIIEDAP